LFFLWLVLQNQLVVNLNAQVAIKWQRYFKWKARTAYPSSVSNTWTKELPQCLSV